MASANWFELHRFDLSHICCGLVVVRRVVKQQIEPTEFELKQGAYRRSAASDSAWPNSTTVCGFPATSPSWRRQHLGDFPVTSATEKLLGNCSRGSLAIFSCYKPGRSTAVQLNRHSAPVRLQCLKWSAGGGGAHLMMRSNEGTRCGKRCFPSQ